MYVCISFLSAECSGPFSTKKWMCHFHENGHFCPAVKGLLQLTTEKGGNQENFLGNISWNTSYFSYFIKKTPVFFLSHPKSVLFPKKALSFTLSLIIVFSTHLAAGLRTSVTDRAKCSWQVVPNGSKGGDHQGDNQTERQGGDNNRCVCVKTIKLNAVLSC